MTDTTMTDWKQLLNDFVADVNQNPNLTDEELQEAYPELNNGSLLDAAWSYRNTLNTKKYDEATLQSKFPEFFSGNGTPQEKSLIQPVEANNPYPAPTVQGRSLKAEEVIRPEDYEDGFVPMYQNQTIKPQALQHRKDNEWLWSPYQSLTNDELNEQIQRLQNPNEKVARELYKARYGKDYAEPKRPQSKWSQFIGNKEEANYRTETGRWAEAVLDASRIEKLENPEIVAQRKDRYARLMQEKMWRNRQEVMPAVGEQITELQQRILTNPKQDGIDMNGAKHLLNKTIDLYNAPSKYGKGNGFVNWGKGLIDQITDYDTWTAGVTDVARMANLNGIVNKMNKQEQLTNEEELVLEAFLLSSAVQDVRSDLSAGYTAGKGAAESIPFMAEMFLTAGAGAAAKKGIVTLAERKLGQAFADKLAHSLGGTIIKDAAGNVVERGATKTMAGKVSKTLAYDFVQTAAMPSTYAKLYQDRVDEILKGDGDFDFLDFTRSFAGSMVETGTERWGGKIIDKGMEKIIPFNAKALWGNNKAFGEFVENYIQSPAGETGEEVIGAAVNTLRSFNPLYNNADENSISNNANLRGELGEMLTPEGLGQTFLTILPMSVFGGSTNLGFNKAYAKYSISNYTKQKEALRQLLQDNGATDEQANRIISQIESSEDDKAFVDKLQMAYDNLVNKHLLENTNESKEDLVKFQNNLNKVLGEYAKSAGRYNTVIGKLQDAYKDLSDKEKAKIDNAMANYMNSVAQTVVDKHIKEEQKTEQEGEQKGENAKQGQPKENPAPQGEVPVGGEQGDKPAPVGEQGENKGEPAKPKTTNKPQQLEKRAIDIEVNGTPMRVVVSGTAVIEEDGSIDFTNKKNRVYIQQTDGRPAARQEIKYAVNTKLREEKAAQKTPVEQTEPTPSVEEKEGAEEVVPPTPPVVETPQGGESVVENDGESAPKPYPTKEDGTPDFEQIGSDPDMSVAAARDMGLDESVLIDNSVARIDEEIATTQKSKKMSVLEQMARVDALEKEKARWENLRKKEENAENPTESLDNQKENSNFADEGGQQNDNGRIQGQSPAGSGENVELGRQGQGVHGGGTQENTPAGSNEMRVGGGSLPDVSITDQLDEQNPQYTVDMDKVEKFEGENGYGDMMEHRDNELAKEQQPKTEQKEEKPQKKQKTDLLGNDIVLLYSPTRQEYVWARKETDGNGNTKYYRVDTGRPFRANVDEGYKGEDGKWVFDKTYKTRQTVKTYQNPHGELKEFETTAYVNLTNKFGGNRVVYLKNGDTYTPYMLQSPFSLDELKNGKTASGRTIGQKIVLMPLQTYGNVVDGKQSATYRLYVENENGEKVPLTKGQENHTGSIEVQSPNGALETVLFENNKAGIRITLADILATPIYTQKRKKTVKDKNGVEHKEDTSGTTQTQVLTTIKLQLQKQFSKLRNDELVAAGDAEMAAKEIQTTLGKIVKGWNEMVEERGLDKLLDEYKDNLDLTTYNKTFSNPTEISLHIPQEGNTAALIKNIKVVMDLAGKLQEELELDDRTNDYLFEEGVYPQVNLDFVRIGSRNEIPTLKKKTTKTKDETVTPEQQDKTGATEQKPTAYRIPNSDDIAQLDYLQDQIDRAEYDGRYDDYVEAVKQYNELYDTFDFSNEKEETRPQRVIEKSQQQFIDDNLSFQRGGTVARAVTPAQRFVTNVVMKALRNVKGISIHRATQEDVARVLEGIKRKSSLDTEIVELFGSPLKVSVVSSEDGARIRKNLSEAKEKLETATWREDNLHTKNAADASSLDDAKLQQKIDTSKRKFENQSIRSIKNPVALLANALELRQTGSSYYGTFQLQDGSFVTLRLSNHNATVSNFDNEGESEGVSIVISAHPSAGIRNDGEAHVIEYFYRKKDLWDAYGTPLADILGDISELLRTGEYRDTTGLAKVEEVNQQDFIEAQNVYENTSEQIETFETPDGRVYGWAVGNAIYLTEDGLNPETPIHEYTHLWAKAMENSDPKGWAKIVRLCKGNKALWESVKNDPNYANIKDDDNRIASEVLSRYAGKHGMERLVQEAEEMAKDGKSFESDVESKLFVSRMKNALKSFWGWVKEKLGIENLDDISNRSLHDLLNSTDLGLEELGLTTEEKRIAEKAKADGTYMQAPNGKPSNLSPKQWLQTRTEAFKEWFGDWEDSSQNKGMLLDENGEPKVVYRGSANDDFVFRSRYGEGTYWFTDNREVAEHYARRGADHELPDYELDGRIQPVFLKLGDSSTYNAEGRNWENVYNEPVYQIVDDESGNVTAEFKTREEAKRYCEENGLDPEIEILESNGVTGDIAAQQFADGKTGVVFENVVDGGSVPSNVYVVRDNGQAKSATENNGAFDEGNPDIRFQIESEQTEQLLDHDEPEPLQPAKRMSWFQRKVNAMLDQSNGIRLLQKRIGEIEGKPITMDEDVREALEAKRSKIANTLERFGNHQRKHLKDALHDVQKSIRTTGLWHKGQTDYYINSTGVRSDRKVTLINVLESYLMAKDTLERISQGKDVRSKELSFRLLQQLGMSVNTPIKTQQQQADVLQKWVDEFESKIDQKQVDALWKAINECTDFALDNLLAGEVIGKNLYDDLKQSRFYVPERGFAQLETDDDIRREVDGRKKHSGAKSTAPEALRRAHGGESMATDVIANILYLGVNSVSCAEENKVRKAAFDLLKNHQEACQELGYPSASRVWYVRDGFNEDGTPRYKAQIEKPSAEMFARNQEVRDLINGFREDMEMFNDNPEMLQYIREQIQETKKDLLIVNKRNAGGAAIDRAALAGEDIPKVLVSVATEDGDVQQYTMAFPNQREIANALNGIMSSKFRDSLLGTIGRQFSALYTTRNPSFFKNNLPKDAMFAMAKGTGERGGAYAAYFAAEMARPATTIVPILEWVTHLDVEGREAGESKWSQSLAKDGSIEREFQQFLDGGGNTGFTQMKDIAEFRKEADQLVNDPNIATKSLSFIFKSLPSAINEFSELWVRFAVYRASKAYMNTENAVIRNVGRAPSDWRRTTEYTPEEIEATALHDARNFTTNFNRHGAGGLADFFMSISMFSNASVQGAMTTWRSFEEGNYQKGVRSALSIMIVPAFIGYLVTKLRPDDEDEESKLPDFIRQNNIVFLDKRIPVSYEMIPWYRIGVNYALMQDGHISKTDGIENIAMGFAEHALPVAPALSTALKDGIDCLIPETDFSAANPDWKDVAVNLMQMQFMNGFNLYAQGKSWTGSNLRYEYAGDKPQYLYQDYEADLYKDISKALYGIKGGDFNNPSITINGKKMGNFYNASPKEIKAFIGNITPSGWVNIACYAYGLGKNLALQDGVDYVRDKDKPFSSFTIEDNPTMFRIGVARELSAMSKEAKENYTRVEGLRNMNEDDAKERIKQWDKLYSDYTALRTMEAGYKEKELKPYIRSLKRNYKIDIDSDKLEDVMHAYVMVMLQEEYDMKGISRTIDDIETWRQRYDKPRISK